MKKNLNQWTPSFPWTHVKESSFIWSIHTALGLTNIQIHRILWISNKERLFERSILSDVKTLNVFFASILAFTSPEVLAALCTSKANGNWGALSTWNCGKVPSSTDSVVLAGPYKVILNNNYTITNLTINAGATLDDANDLTVRGDIINNGTWGVNGGNTGRIYMTGPGTTISGTGVMADSRLYIDAPGIILSSGSTQNLTNDAQIRVGSNNTASFTLDGTITGTGQTVGNRLFRVYNWSDMTINGSVNAPNSDIDLQKNASITNNGSVNVQNLTSANSQTAIWNQGANSNLTVSQTPTNVWRWRLNAMASDNTVMYNGSATPLSPSSNTYYNLMGNVTCPSSFTILWNSPCKTTPHHLEIQSSSALGVTCMSTIFTVKACANALCSTLYTTGVTGNITTTGTPLVNFTGGNTFTIPSGSSTTTKSIQVTTPWSVLFSSTGGTNATTCNFGSPTCTYSAADAAFLVTAPNHIAGTSQTLTIQSVKKSDNSASCVPGMTGNKTVNLKHIYLNPTTGSQSARVNGTTITTTGANIPLTFNASGIATPTLQYGDVGNVRIDANYTGTIWTIDAGLTLVGSGSFIATPKAFTFSTPSTGLNKAWVPFTAFLMATNNNWTVTPNFWKETIPEWVTLSSLLVSPAAGTNPGLINNIISGNSFVSGTLTTNNLRFDEVGTIAIKADLTNGTYLGTSAVTGTSGNFGRFIPDHFNTSIVPPMICSGMTCPTSGMAYSGQPFTTSIIAKSGMNTTTLNYDSALGSSKQVTLTAASAIGGTVSSVWSITAGIIPATSFSAGSSIFTPAPKPIFTFANSPTLPTDIYIRATDTDGATSLQSPSSNSVENGLKIVSGKIKVSNGYGSELLPLPITTEIQYYNSSSFWTKNISDSTTLIDTASNFVQTIIKWPLTSLTPTNSIPLTTSAGKVNLILQKPGVSGSANFSVSVPPYLSSNTGNATFGIYKSPIIYRRENY